MHTCEVKNEQKKNSCILTFYLIINYLPFFRRFFFSNRDLLVTVWDEIMVTFSILILCNDINDIEKNGFIFEFWRENVKFAFRKELYKLTIGHHFSSLITSQNSAILIFTSWHSHYTHRKTRRFAFLPPTHTSQNKAIRIFTSWQTSQKRRYNSFPFITLVYNRLFWYFRGEG